VKVLDSAYHGKIPDAEISISESGVLLTEHRAKGARLRVPRLSIIDFVGFVYLLGTKVTFGKEGIDTRCGFAAQKIQSRDGANRCGPPQPTRSSASPIPIRFPCSQCGDQRIAATTATSKG
jgi:hypothetical protein